MRWKQIGFKYRRILCKTTIQAVGLAVLLSGIYSGCLFLAFYANLKQAQSVEFQKVARVLQGKMQCLQGVLEHISDCVQAKPCLDAQKLGEIVADMRFSSPLNFPVLTALTWVQTGQEHKGGDVLPSNVIRFLKRNHPTREPL